MFYNFRKNKKAFTLVELIVVIAIIAILGAVVGVTVSRFVDSAREKAALSPVNGLADNWESYKIESPNMTIKEVIAELFGDEKKNFSASSNIWATTIGSLNSTVNIYYHDSNCGKYYGQLKIESGAVKKSNVSALEATPSGSPVAFPNN